MSNASPLVADALAANDRQHVVFQEHALRKLEQLLRELSADRVLLVVDRGAFVKSGAASVVAGFSLAGRLVEFDQFKPNPKLGDIEHGIELFREINPDAIVAIGGGSAIDVAKVVSNCGANAGTARDYVTGVAKLIVDGPPLIAVPTTAGTGSEATHFAVVYVDGEKYSLAHEFLRPEFVVLDPLLTASASRTVAASAGLDALCQAIESLWAASATEASLGFATRAAELAVQHLESAVLAPTPAARRGMVLAAHLAGLAIDISRTTGPHAFSYALTTGYGVPHGAAVALTLAPFLQFNSQVDDANCADPRGADHVRRRIDQIVRLLGASDVPQACERWQSLLVRLGCRARLRDAGVNESDLESLMAKMNAERLANNPRKFDRDCLRTLLTAHV